MQSQTSPSIIDIEASGFGPNSYPIEIGIVKGSGERYCALVKPHSSWNYWSDTAEKVHGIARSTIMKQGCPIKQVCEELNEFLRGEQIYSDAWAHDTRWLCKLFEIAEMNPSFKLHAIEFIMLEKQYELWDNVKQCVRQQLNIERHRASNDAFLIQQTFIQSLFKC